MNSTPVIVRVAVPSPLRRLFDYRLPAGLVVTPGQRVKVPFGRTTVVGLVIETAPHSEVPAARLRDVAALLDELPVLDQGLLSLLRWAAAYYQHPIGEVMAAALPVALRQGRAIEVPTPKAWRLTAQGRTLDGVTPARAPRQQALLAALTAAPAGIDEQALNERFDDWRAVMRRLADKGWVEPFIVERTLFVDAQAAERPSLNEGQAQAATRVCAQLQGFHPFLLEGVTGSGKTEVYLTIIEQVVASGRQALVLVPEIGLTPQLVQRFEQRFRVPIAMLHSGLTDRERLGAWQDARNGRTPIIIGTRSAVFTPLAQPGILIVDEEHDASFKQQEGFRYSARDLAIKRAADNGIPIVLGSATPSLESVFNVRQGRYQHLPLPERAGSAAHPVVKLVDVRGQKMPANLSAQLLKQMRATLAQGEQVLLFINRRGFAPTLLCHDCGWLARCSRCDAHLVVHRNSGRLRCHHCGKEQPLVPDCPACHSVQLRDLGHGTERIEQSLAELFPQERILRIDRDSTRRKGSFEAMLTEIHQGRARILVGTQMLAKGHDFPGVTLVGILDVDQGLFSADFRAGERMAQTIVQVAGRAGRAERPGLVLVQTHHPEHPLLQRLVAQGYGPYCQAALLEREGAMWPPFTYLALLRAEAVEREAPMLFLEQARDLALQHGGAVTLLGPVPAPMERRAGRYRAQLLVQAPERGPLHRLLTPWAQQLETLKSGRKVRWSLDIDPIELF